MPRSSVACCACFTLLAVFPSARACHLNASVPFIRGDADASGTVTVADAIRILRFTFQREEAADIGCLDAADADDNGSVELMDALFISNYLFLHGRRPPFPFPACSLDPTAADGLACARYTACPGGPLDDLLVATQSVVFVVDRSRSMQSSGQLAIARRELHKEICVLAEDVELGLVFFDESFVKFPADGPPLPLTPENRALANAFVESQTAGVLSCPRDGLLGALDMLAVSGAGTKAIVFIGCSDPCREVPEAEYLEETLRAVRERNTQGVRIHTIGVLLQGNEPRRRFLRELAEQNGGMAILVDR